MAYYRRRGGYRRRWGGYTQRRTYRGYGRRGGFGRTRFVGRRVRFGGRRW